MFFQMLLDSSKCSKTKTPPFHLKKQKVADCQLIFERLLRKQVSKFQNLLSVGFLSVYVCVEHEWREKERMEEKNGREKAKQRNRTEVGIRTREIRQKRQVEKGQI